MTFRIATVEQLAERLQRAHERGEKTAVLLGAGASKSAGIPLADEFCDEIERTYARNVEGVERSYGAYMERLTHAERDELLRPYMEKAKITETYTCLANLVGSEFVDVVYNVNFDHLAEETLRRAETGSWFYDIADSLTYQPGRTRLPALLYLHGKFGGFNNIHTPDGMKAVRQRVADTLKEHLSSRTVLVVGYSGLVDPVFHALVHAFREFDRGLYWVSLQTEPTPHVLTGLLADSNRQAHFLGGIDSDKFFRELCARLGLRQLLQLRDPIGYLRRSYDAFNAPLAQESRQRLNDIVLPATIESRRVDAPKRPVNERKLAAQVRKAWNEEDFETLANLASVTRESSVSETRRLVSFGLYNRGTARATEALRQTTVGRYEGLLQARNDLALSTDLNPELLQAFLNLGLVLLRLADLDAPSGGERDRFLEDAYVQFEHAAELAPALSDPFDGLAHTHVAIARSATDKSARLANLKEAANLYWRAVFNYRGDHRLLNNWGIVLKDIADVTEGTPARMAFESACEKFTRAAIMEPDSPNAHYNWALTLHGWAERDSPDETPELLEQASRKYMEAIRLAPDRFEASYNRGVVFMDLQRTSGLTKDARKDLLGQACEMFRLATQANPDLYEGFYNWGNALVLKHSMSTVGGRTADIETAVDKLSRSVELRPDAVEAHNNLGVALTVRAASSASSEEKLPLYLRAIGELRLARDLDPGDVKTMRALADALQQLGRLQKTADAGGTFREALRLYDEILTIQTTEPSAHNMCSSAWLGLASAAPGSERTRAITEAEWHARRADELRRGAGAYNLACAVALAGRTDEAFALLESALQLTTEETRAHIEADSDLDSLKKAPRWNQLLDKYRPRKPQQTNDDGCAS